MVWLFVSIMQPIYYTRRKIIRAIHHIWIKGLFSWNDFERLKKKKKSSNLCTKCNCDNEGPILMDICRRNLIVNSCLIQAKKTLERTYLYLIVFVGIYRFCGKNPFSFHTNDPRKWILHWRSMHVEMNKIGITVYVDLVDAA
jgi:hypothetical protein